MKVNLDQPLVDFDGKPIREGNRNEPGDEFSLKKVITAALSTPLDEDKGMSTDKVVARWKLACRVHGGGEQELTAEELVEIKGRLPKVYPSALIAGQACEMLKG